MPELQEAVHAARFFAVEIVGRIEALDFARDPHVEVAGVEQPGLARRPSGRGPRRPRSTATSSPTGVTAPMPVIDDAALPFAFGETSGPGSITLASVGSVRTLCRLELERGLRIGYHSPALPWHSGTESANLGHPPATCDRADTPPRAHPSPRRSGIRRPGAAGALGPDRPQVRSRALAGHRAQRAGGPRRSRPDRPAAHLGRPCADRSRLPLLRRAADARGSAAWRPAERRTLRQQFNHLAASGTDSTHLGASLLVASAAQRGGGHAARRPPMPAFDASSWCRSKTTWCWSRC